MTFRRFIAPAFLFATMAPTVGCLASDASDAESAEGANTVSADEANKTNQAALKNAKVALSAQLVFNREKIYLGSTDALSCHLALTGAVPTESAPRVLLAGDKYTVGKVARAESGNWTLSLVNANSSPADFAIGCTENKGAPGAKAFATAISQRGIVFELAL
jgi:hypothetical protein